jgi:hypothetical protein
VVKKKNLFRSTFVALDLPPRKTLKRVVEKYKANTIFPCKTMLGGEETKSILNSLFLLILW